MANPGIERMMMLLSITERGSGRGNSSTSAQQITVNTAPATEVNTIPLRTRAYSLAP